MTSDESTGERQQTPSDLQLAIKAIAFLTILALVLIALSLQSEGYGVWTIALVVIAMLAVEIVYNRITHD